MGSIDRTTQSYEFSAAAMRERNRQSMEASKKIADESYAAHVEELARREGAIEADYRVVPNAPPSEE